MTVHIIGVIRHCYQFIYYGILLFKVGLTGSLNSRQICVFLFLDGCQHLFKADFISIFGSNKSSRIIAIGNKLRFGSLHLGMTYGIELLLQPADLITVNIGTVLFGYSFGIGNHLLLGHRGTYFRSVLCHGRFRLSQ